MPTSLTSITGVLKNFGLPGTAAALESDLATLLGSTTPEGLLAKGAVMAAGAYGGNQIIAALTGGSKKKKTTTRSKKSRSSKSRRHSSTKHRRKLKFGSKAYRKKYLGHK